MGVGACEDWSTEKTVRPDTFKESWPPGGQGVKWQDDGVVVFVQSNFLDNQGSPQVSGPGRLGVKDTTCVASRLTRKKAV